MKLLKKLSAADILGNIIEIVKGMGVGDTVEAYGVAGICDAYETGASTFGEWTRFVGDLQAINYLTGEVSRAPKAHVPDVLEAAILNGVKERAEVVSTKCTKDTQFFKLAAPIEFAYKVQVTRLADDEKGGVSYKYTTLPQTEVKTNDAISHLTNLLEPPKEETVKPAPKAKAK